MLTSGNTIRSRRTVLTREELSDLVQADRVRRFVLWRALSRRYGWPPLLLVSRDAGVPMLVVRDSALAVEAALEGLREGVTFMTIEEPDEQPWLVDEEGNAYVTELIVPFVRRTHAWSDVAAGQRRAS